MTGLAIECATSRIEIAVLDERGQARAHEVEEVGHGHVRRLTPLIRRALETAGVLPTELAWIAADLGPGSFTGVRVGIATASALAQVSGARLGGASSLESLAHTCGARGALVVALVEAGRRDVYAGFFRSDQRGVVRWLAAPVVGPVAEAISIARECAEVLRTENVLCVGPGARRERESLESAFPGSTELAWRFEGLSALDLAVATGARTARAATASAGASDGELPAALTPLYVRPAQAEERVRRRALADSAPQLREFNADDVAAAVRIERRVFNDPWTESFFHGELGAPHVHARAVECGGELAGYSLAWLGEGSGHLGNLAVAPEHRRRGIARALIEDLLDQARARAVASLSLEVRTTNFAAQALYRGYGFRLAGLRRGYYRDNAEDALVLEWNARG